MGTGSLMEYEYGQAFLIVGKAIWWFVRWPLVCILWAKFGALTEEGANESLVYLVLLFAFVVTLIATNVTVSL